MSDREWVPGLGEAQALARRWCLALPLPGPMRRVVESPWMSGHALGYLAAYGVATARRPDRVRIGIGALAELSFVISMIQGELLARPGELRKQALLELYLRELLCVDEVVGWARDGEPASWQALLDWLTGQRRLCEDRLAAASAVRGLDEGADPLAVQFGRGLTTVAELAVGRGDGRGGAALGEALGEALAGWLRARELRARPVRGGTPDEADQPDEADAPDDHDQRAAHAAARVEAALGAPARALAPLRDDIAGGGWDCVLDAILRETSVPRFERHPAAERGRSEASGNGSAHDPRDPIAAELRPLMRLTGSALADDIAAVHAEPGGKLLRGLLTLYFAELLGEPRGSAVQAAAAVEQIHLASLLIDDVIDRSPVRHNRPTVAARQGDVPALNVARYLCLTCVARLLDGQPPGLYAGMRRAVIEMISGERSQVIDGEIPSWAHYLRTIEQKSAALFAFACRSGVLVAGGNSTLLDTAGEIGLAMGLAFQISDDYLDYFGRSTGKALGTDFHAGTFTAPTLLFVDEAPGERELVIRSLARRMAPGITFDDLRQRMVDHGINQKTLGMARQHAERAHRLLEHFPADRSVYCELERIISATVERDH
jgi:geranylgeranyl pyrophosphate synthase